MKGKYPKKLFGIGLVSDFLFHYFFLSFPAVVFLVIGIWKRPCLYVSAALLLLDLLLSVRERLRIKQAFETESDHPVFSELQKAVCSSDWETGTKEFFDRLEKQHDPSKEP